MWRRIRQAWAYYRRMIAFARRVGEGNHAAVLAAGERVLAIRPEETAVLEVMAGAAAALGDHDTARQLWRRALELAPERFELLRKLADSFVEAGDHERAYPLVRRALAHAPRLPQPIDRTGLRLDRLAGLVGRRPDATERYRRQHTEWQTYLEGWVEWAEQYVEWCSAVFGDETETVH